MIHRHLSRNPRAAGKILVGVTSSRPQTNIEVNAQEPLKEGEVRCPHCQRGVRPRKDGSMTAHYTARSRKRGVPCIGTDLR